MMELFTLNLVAFGLGIASSWTWWRFVSTLRPRLEISSQLARSVTENGLGNGLYRLKIANVGKRAIIDITATMTICALREVPGGYVSSAVQKLPILHQCLALGERRSYWSPWDVSPIYIFRISPDFDLESELSIPDTRIMLTLMAKDSLSGATAVHRRTYSLEDILDGDFARGLTLEIRSNNAL